MSRTTTPEKTSAPVETPYVENATDRCHNVAGRLQRLSPTKGRVLGLIADEMIREARGDQ